MRIHDAYTKLDRATRTDGAATTRESGAGGAKEIGVAAGAPPSTSVSLSARAHELARAAESAGAGRVAELREQYKRGELRVDAHAIARKLIGDDE